MEERKKLLKEIKKRIGGGGSLIEGIVEVQGSHSDVVLKTLKSKGYTQAAKK
jgi:translation initiation factor 1 (eIF-1/SUI1)